MVSLFLFIFIDDVDNRLLHNNIMMIRYYGEEKEESKQRCGGVQDQQRRPRPVGVPIQAELEFNSNSRNSLHQNHRPD
jgi:hypothetical protein